MITILKNGNAFIDGNILPRTIVIENGKISKILEVSASLPKADKEIDCSNKYIFPGFIDLHIHGGGGGFSQDITKEQYEKIVRTQLGFGTTSILLTLIGPSDAELSQSSALIKEIATKKNGANILGLHLEGPWISPKKIGYLSKELFEFVGNVEHAKKIVSLCKGYLKIVTLAPEVENIDKIISELAKHDIIASCGHTEAGYDLTVKSVGWGIKSFTHLWNMSGPVQSRDPGVVGAAMASDDCYIEIVADGFHVHPINIKNTIRTKPYDKICLVTDAMVVTGTKDTSFSFMGVNDIQVVDGRTVGPNNAIIGSILTLDKALKNVIEWTGLPIEQVVPMVTENPARMIEIFPQKGVLRVGADADVAVFDKDLICCSTLVDGKLLYE